MDSILKNSQNQDEKSKHAKASVTPEVQMKFIVDSETGTDVSSTIAKIDFQEKERETDIGYSQALRNNPRKTRAAVVAAYWCLKHYPIS